MLINQILARINNEIKLSKLISRPLYLKNSKEDWLNYRKNCANREKNKLIQTIESNNVVIDIGFGKGGDIFKYREQKIQRIIGIEPDFDNIKEFFERFKILDYDIEEFKLTKIFDKVIKVKDFDMYITVINRSATDSEIPDILLELLKYNQKNIVVTMFFSLTYFFNPYDDFVKLIYNICRINPIKIIGTVMDGKKTDQFLNKFYWNPQKCGLDLKLISKNKIFISIAESATVSGHVEFLTDLDRFENNLSWYYFNLVEKNYFNFDLGNDSLLTHFAALNCSFVFYNSSPKYSLKTREGNVIRKPLNHLYSLNQLILSLNSRLGLTLDSTYIYSCFKKMQLKEGYDIGNTIKLIENFEQSRFISKYYIKKVIEENSEYEDNEIYYFVYNDKEYKLNNDNLNKARSLLLKNKIDNNFRIIYEIENTKISNTIANNILKKIFKIKDTNKLILTNQYYDFYSENDNSINNIINLLEEFLSPIINYNLIEINPGIGIFTVEFIKIFKSIITITNNSDLNYYFLVNNFVNYYNISYPYENIIESDTLIKNVKLNYKDKEILLINEKNEKSESNINRFSSDSVVFVNYLFNDIPNLEDIFKINCKYIIIYSSKLIDIGKYSKLFFLDVIRNNYIYIISKDDIITKIINENQISSDLSLKNIKYLYSNDKNKLLELFMKNLKFSGISQKEIIDIILKYENDNQILLELNKLKFLKNPIKNDSTDGDIIRGKARIKEIYKLFDENDIYLNINENSKYLDIGSGNGIITETIGKTIGFDYENIYGIEIENWQEKEHKINKTAVKTSYISGTTLPFENNSFDLISCIMSIHRFEYKNDMLNEIQRVLKPNGILIIREHEYDHSRELKNLIDLEHAIFATVINEKMNLEEINNFWKTYIGDYFSFEELKNDLEKRDIFSLTKFIVPKGVTNYYWCVFRKREEKNEENTDLNKIILQHEKFKQEEKEFIEENIKKGIDFYTIIDTMLVKYRINKIKEINEIEDTNLKKFMIKSYYYINWQKGPVIKN